MSVNPAPQVVLSRELRLQRKHALVFGAGGGVGAAVAKEFAAEGADVFLSGRTRSNIEAVTRQIKDDGGLAHAALIDAVEEAEVGPYVDGIAKEVGSIDVERYQVEQVFEVFEAGAERGRIGPPVVRPVIFIGHGRSPHWQELRDHLRDRHGLECEAFESGPQAGRLAKDVVEGMASAASFALLVHSAEDEQADGSMRARENVVHETGLFQGRLGFERAIILREEGCGEFSNIAGLQEIRFHAGNIRETFGDVVATIRREFPDL